MFSPLVRGLLVLFLLSPFLFLIWQFGQQDVLRGLDWRELRWAFENSFWQAAGSATFSLLLGLWGATGLLRLSSWGRPHWRAVLEIFLLAPNFLPAIFTLLAVLNVVDPFPMGRPGIILVHTVLNWGLVAVLLAGLLEKKVGPYAELAWIEGASRWRFLRVGVLPLLRKDLLLLWVFVFVICFGSFAVPLVVGGGRGTTLEVLIYEKIRLSTDWSQAVAVAALQTVFLFLLSWVATRGQAEPEVRPASLPLFQSWSGLLVILAGSAFLLLGYAQGFFEGLSQAGHFWELREEIWWAVLGSLSLSLGTGFLCLGLLALVARLEPSRGFEIFLRGYSAPSQALTGFAFLVLTPNEGLWPFVKIPVALALMSLPTLWRMGGESALEGLRRQRDVARTLGASENEIFRFITWPQIHGKILRLSGLATVWACGDFAFSRILAHRDLTIAMMTETLMGSYRLGLATLMSVLLAIVALVALALLWGVGRVLGRRPVL